MIFLACSTRENGCQMVNRSIESVVMIILGLLGYTMKLICILLFTLLPVCLVAQTNSDDEIPEKIVDFSVSTYHEGSNLYLAVSYGSSPGWHTYWKNPGDAGTPIKINFKHDESQIEFQALEWPAPKRFIENGNMWAYGYSGEYTIFYQIPAHLDGVRLTVESKWLSCKNICIQGAGQISGRIEGEKFISDQGLEFELSRDVLAEHFSQIPKKSQFPDNLDMTLARSVGHEGRLALYFNLENPSGDTPSGKINMLTPFPEKVFGFKHEYIYKDGSGDLYGKLEIDWNGKYLEPKIKMPADGKFSKPYILRFLYSDPETKKIVVIRKQFSSFGLNNAERLENFFSLVKKIEFENNPHDMDVMYEDEIEVDGEKKNVSIIYYLLLALIGGLILNFMPCVLPVISIKLFGLIRQRELSRMDIFKHNLSYVTGILFSFFVMALVVIVLKIQGATIGWGFQMQSPVFVSIMILILFVFSLNLFGLFEFSILGGKTLGNVKLKSGYRGDFFGGVLATVLATPCSAPFLGVALAFAFTTDYISIMIMFLAIGSGLALPFIFIGIFPGLISILPRPGVWMEHLQKFLGMALIVTVVWLFQIFCTISNDQEGPVKIILISAFLFFAFYIRKNIIKNKMVTFIIFVIPICLAGYMFVQTEKENNTGQIQELIWEEWSVEKMEEYKNLEEPLFIYFTADWCLTCKVYEKLVLKSDEFRNVIMDNNIKLLKGDWTRSDNSITKWLKENGRVAVPSYFFQKPDGTLINFGETISVDKLMRLL